MNIVWRVILICLSLASLSLQAQDFTIPPQQCDAFNGMQTWKDNPVNLITMENHAVVSGGGSIKGQVRFTNDIVNQYPGFIPEVPIEHGLCDGKSCSLSNDSDLPDFLNFSWQVSSEARIING